MNQYVLIIIVFLAFLVILRLRARSKKKRSVSPLVYSRRVDGMQINAYIHPAISEQCLFDHGIQYGKGFRRKEGPLLPHNDTCQCEDLRFSFTSTEVFNGALRNPTSLRSSIEGLTLPNSFRLVEAMKSKSGQPLPDTPEDYVATVFGEWEPEKGQKHEIEQFLRERFDLLRSRQTALPPVSGQGSAPPDTDPSNSVAESSPDSPEVV